ncbi:MBL fold metallo-hydrolase [candidate division KSB1 bacterium]|nr:MBL fold metallo-hydrolase [candidate division KSB1 bacterium]
MPPGNKKQQSDKGIDVENKDLVKITILYDNYKHSGNTKPAWGFSCLLEGTQKTILFDTGGDADILAHNMDALNVDVEKIQLVVLSHNHWDHTGGLARLLEKNPAVTIYVPQSFPDDFVNRAEDSGARVVAVDQPARLCQNVYSTGEMDGPVKEQSLILKTSQGLVIVTGCSHPGILNILKHVKSHFDDKLYLVFGGFHLLQHSEAAINAIIEEFKHLGVVQCGATHCTGDLPISLFKRAYGENYIEMGTGKILNLPE